MSSALERLRFDNRVLAALPVDAEKANFIRQVSGACFSYTTPTPVQTPQIVAVSPAALNLIGLPEDVAEKNKTSFAEYFSGNRLFMGSEPASHCYCGHQFGNFAGQLGDGAAIYLGEVQDEATKKHLAEIQLKGAGPTPYSRSADGRKVLRSSIREFLASEAMYALGIPTTRAVSCVTSDSCVERDPLYTGKVIQEKCTVVCRAADTFIRFGSFEVCKPESDNSDRHGPSEDEPELLNVLFDFVASTYYPEELKAARDVCTTTEITAVRAKAAAIIFEEITKRTAHLVAQWQCVGFCHGVLNTDNMSITGLTIDYGPYGFMSYFDENHICNHSDDSGRYSYKNQPVMCKWNLMKLAEAWTIMTPQNKEVFESIVDTVYDEEYKANRRAIMNDKLGLPPGTHLKNPDLVDQLDTEVFELMQKTSADMTDVFKNLRKVQLNPKAAEDGTTIDANEHLKAIATDIAAVCAPPHHTATVLQRKIQRGRPQMHPMQITQLLSLLKESPDTLSQMFNNAPIGVIEAHLHQELASWENVKEGSAQLKLIREMDATMKKKSDLQEWSTFLESYRAQLKALWGDDVDGKERQAQMRQANPTFILKPWILRDAIEEAERSPKGYRTIQNLLDRCLHPFEEDDRDDDEWMMEPPTDTCNICVSCSS